jgi:ribosomal protein L29
MPARSPALACLADLEAEVDALRRELAHAQGERDAASAIAAAKIEAAERIIAELRTMLSEARRAWRRHVSLT